jgi:hypothetical protein
MFSPQNIIVNIIVSFCLTGVICLALCGEAGAQKNRSKGQAKKAAPVSSPTPQPEPAVKNEEKYDPGVVVDEKLAVLRLEPSLYSIPLQRMRRGRMVLIYASKEADGVLFYSVGLPPDKRGWVQADAIATTVRRGDDERLVKLIQASEGFEQIERATIFLETYHRSALRPAILLFLGDLIEETAEKLSLEANRRLDKGEMAATGAPVHSFFLNYNGLDRYRRLGIIFLFNVNTRYFHYDGGYWKEIIKDFPLSSESGEAKKRLESLKLKIEKTK